MSDGAVHTALIAFLAFLAGVIVMVGNDVFNQGWGVGHFFLIWIIELVIVYGGFVILDGDAF